MSGVPVFWVEKTGEYRFQLMWSCEACGEVTRRFPRHGTMAEWDAWTQEKHGPVPCDHCSEIARFSGQGAAPLYRDPATGKVFCDDGDKLPAGACYADPEGAWDPKQPGGKRFGPDGRALVVVLPNGHHWAIDSRCNNCGSPDDLEHRCWCRHGRPEDGTLHVDKDCATCSAGAGSIQSGSFYGFLHHGHLIVA